ncbi:hypothetical protein, partial [Bacillus sp. WP8]|uniref:hypothetical protein n=1 Tax=Bacillus sp. WP8 TaxID=756828 RepID=UPI001C92FE0A
NQHQIPQFLLFSTLFPSHPPSNIHTTLLNHHHHLFKPNPPNPQLNHHLHPLKDLTPHLKQPTLAEAPYTQNKRDHSQVIQTIPALQ